MIMTPSGFTAGGVPLSGGGGLGPWNHTSNTLVPRMIRKVRRL